MNKYLHVFLGCMMAVTCAQAQGDWVKKADFPELRFGAFAFSIGDTGYVGGGASPSQRQNDFWKYDPQSDAWEQLDSLPFPGREGAFSFVIDDTAYVGGGLPDLGFPRNEFWRYAPQARQWTRKGDLPFGLITQDNTTAFAISKKGYVRASYNQDDFWEYDPDTDTWKPRAHFSGSGKLNQAGFAVGSKGYIGTGFDGAGQSKEFWEYDPNADVWTRKMNFPGTPRNGAVGFSIGSRGYIGLGNSSGTLPSDFWAYNPETNSWSQIDSCGYGTDGAFAFSIGAKAYVGTGLFTAVGEFWEYTSISSSIQAIEQRPSVNIFPNPVSKTLHVELNDPTRSTNFVIHNIQGQSVMNGRISGNGIPVSDLPAGLYVLLLQDEDQIFSERFIKE